MVSFSVAATASSPGARRRLTRARATGTTWFDEPWIAGASMPRTATAGPAHTRSAIEPLPMVWSPSTVPASSRKSPSG